MPATTANEEEVLQCSTCESTEYVSSAIFNDQEGPLCQGCIDSLYRCDWCHEYYTDLEHSNPDICDNCWRNAYTCEDCNEIVYEDDTTTTVNDTIICHNCRNNSYIHCYGCNYAVHEAEVNYNEDEDLNYCNNCYSNSNSSYYISQKKPKNGSRHFTKGDIITTNRGFGVELEFTYDNNKAKNLEKLPKTIGICGDGSISGRGLEVQTPVLFGKRGELYIKDTCKTIKSAGGDVNSSCGVHVHIDAQDFRGPKNYYRVKALYYLYTVFEDVIMSMLPMSRRANTYSKSLKDAFSVTEIEKKNSIEDIEMMWYKSSDYAQAKSAKESGRYHSSRYYGLNLHSLFANGHHEIRYHAGSLDPNKILHWTQLHLAMADYVINNAIHVVNLFKKADRMYNIHNKFNFLAETINLNETTTNYLKSRIKKFEEEEK